jgi:hypothetical protein
VPELPAGYVVPFADDRPVGLRRRSIPAGGEIWRVDASPPAAWDWAGFPEPRSRFDPRSGAFRTRYAGATLLGAFRERYRSTGLVIPADHRTHHLVRLVSARNLRVLDLRTEKNLDVLQVDDQISTGHILMSGPPAIDLSTPPGAGGPTLMRSSIGHARRPGRH